MKQIDFGQTVTLVANFGVIFGIVFLVIEVQQNTQTIKAAAVQDSVTTAREQIQLFASDADTNRINMIGVGDPSRLSPEELQRYVWITRSGLLGIQGLFRQWELEILPDDDWEVWEKVLCANTATAGFHALWPENAEILNPRFVARAEACPQFQQYIAEN